MNKLAIFAGAAVLLSASTLVSFADTATATVSSIDTTAGALKLSNGKVYYAPAALLASLMVDQTVTVTYTADASGKLNASDVQPEPEYK